ncbi:MAG: tyrosine-type recombinase/integrase [Thalassotalea sp.]
MSLTDTKLRKIKAPYKGKPELSDRDGLSARVSPSGTITFNYRFRFHGKQQRIKIGSYPVVTLAEARLKINEYKKVLSEGLDPRQVRDEQLCHRLLGDITADFMAKYVMKELKPKTQALYKSTFNKYVIPFANIDMEKHKYTDWIKYFDWVKEQSSSANAGGVLKRFKAVANWAKSRGQITHSHIIDMPIKAVGAHQISRDRCLEWEEVVGLWRQVEASKSTPKCKVCVQLLLLTGARNSEIREASRTEFNLKNKLWILPEERSKTGKKIRRPLSKGSINLINYLDLIYGENREYLIEGDKQGKPLTTHSLNRFVQRMNNHLKYPHFVPHDFRRTIVTRLSEMEVMPHVTEKMLGHELGGIMAIYNKHDWIDEQRKAYELYWNTLNEFLKSS